MCKLVDRLLFGYRRGVAGFGCAGLVGRSVTASHPYCILRVSLIR